MKTLVCRHCGCSLVRLGINEDKAVAYPPPASSPMIDARGGANGRRNAGFLVITSPCLVGAKRESNRLITGSRAAPKLGGPLQYGTRKPAGTGIGGRGQSFRDPQPGFQLTRIARQYPRRPVSHRVPLRPERHLRLPQRVGLAQLVLPELGVEELHQPPGRRVVYLPE